MTTTWIVVADACRARLMSAHRPDGALHETEALANPEARLHEGDLVSDRGGRDSNRDGSTHGLDTGDKAKSESADRFAAEVCERLEEGRRRSAFSRLYVVGAPAFLGLMRKHQSNALRGTIVGEVAKDITTQSLEQIRARLPQPL
jgi:protein required for attachment to host cells